METEETQETTEEQSLNPLDNFDTRTPAQVASDALREAEETTEEEPAEETETTEEETSEETQEETEEAPKYQPPKKITLDTPTFNGEIPVDEYGNIDASKFGDYLQQRDEYVREMARVEANNAFLNNTHITREWSDVEARHGDLLKSNPDARQMIDSLRTTDAINGGEGILMEAADKVAALVGTTKAAATKAAQTNVTVQKSVGLTASPRTKSSDSNRVNSLRKAAMSGGPNADAARVAYITEMYESGQLGN